MRRKTYRLAKKFGRPKVLVVDDEKDIVDMIVYNLERNGFEVVCAFNGNEAKEAR